MLKNFSWIFGKVGCGNVKENKEKEIFKNQPKRTLSRPVISEWRKVFRKRLNFTPLKFQISEKCFLTVDSRDVNVLTNRKSFSYQKFFKKILASG